MRQFVAQGYLLLQTDFAPSFHERLLGELTRVYREEGNPGNNLLPRIRELQQAMEHPVIRGALTSVLGPGYLLHAHRHGHFNNSPQPGAWHKDSYWGYKRMRHHHPWWAMIMYFPQDTPVELGPTGIMPGTQYSDTRTFREDEQADEAKASGPAGTFALIHYDIWHRSTANLAGKERYMLKFEFMRVHAPSGPSWNCRSIEWRTPDGLPASMYAQEAVWEEVWGWLCGRLGPEEQKGRLDSAGRAAAAQTAAEAIAALASPDAAEQAQAADRLAHLPGPMPEAVQALGRTLAEESEPAALNAAYGLARMGIAGVAEIGRALRGERARVSRLAAYGLSAAGARAVPVLAEALADDREGTVVHAAFALGELRQLASGEEGALVGLLAHPASAVRQAAAEALGMIGAPEAGIAEALGASLADEDAQVRFTAGLALARLGAAADAAVPQLIGALEDENRYVRAHAADALFYVGTERAKDALLGFLRASRWCPTTTPASTFYP
ncbi:hypothetical protein J31TS4_04210 [Paenibacillus sp. J31TS4]|nr:hypothetical protein J31TS4_04210 [Paenibacillus sp. J31TS4]